MRGSALYWRSGFAAHVAGAVFHEPIRQASGDRSEVALLYLELMRSGRFEDMTRDAIYFSIEADPHGTRFNHR